MAGERTSMDRVWIAGAAGCVLALVAASVLPASAWRAWLAAAFACTAAPIGAVGLLMIMRLTPGDWSEELGPFAEAGAVLAPVCALLMAPVLAAMGALYGWTHEPQRTAFRAAYLSEPLFALRTVVWFAVLIGLAFLLVVRRARAPAVSCIGLVLFPILGSLVAVDWLLSLDSGFASSGFGLYVLCIQMMTALALMIAALLLSGREVRRPGIMGGLLLCLLLMWSYFAFLQFFITWSDNLPPGVRWYQTRGFGGWSAVMWIVAATRLIPTFLLLFRTIRRSPRALLVLALTIAAGTVLESAWLALPAAQGAPPARPADLVLFAFATLSMVGLMAGTFPRALAWRERRAAHGR